MPRPHPTVVPYEPDESFVNVGYFTWLHQRKAWREKAPRSKGQRLRAVPLDIDGIVRAIRTNKPSHGLAGGTPVPLVQMLDILGEVWEVEGLRKL